MFGMAKNKNMKKTQLGILAVIISGLISASAAEEVLGFDDITLNHPGAANLAAWGVVPTSYGGLTWTGWEVVNGSGAGHNYQNVYNNSYGPVSGTQFAYNGGDGYKTISTGGTAFNFDGAYVTSFAQNNAYQSFSSQNLTINAYNGNLLVGSWTGSISPSSFVALPDAAHFDDITSLEFISDAVGKYWGLDNFTYSMVPEPVSTTKFAGLSALGLLLVTMRRKF